jgi:hypothetical protein
LYFANVEANFSTELIGTGAVVSTALAELTPNESAIIDITAKFLTFLLNIILSILKLIISVIYDLNICPNPSSF